MLVAVSGGDSTGALGPVEIAVLAVDVLSGLIAAAYLSSRLPRS